MKLTFLGTGTSFGVPQIGCECAVCASTDPRDKRTRCAVVVESAAGARILIDTPPELRLQLLAAGVRDVDAVFFTHDHADHIHGIDDIRAFTVRRGEPLPMFGPEESLAHLRTRFPYIFDDALRPLPGTSKPEGRAHAIDDGDEIAVRDLSVRAIAVPHGLVRVLGYRIGPIGYVTDAKSIPPSAVAALQGVRVLVLNALFHKAHPTHLSIGDAVEVARRVGAPCTYLTHLTHENFHRDLAAELPPEIQPAFDGLVVHVTHDGVTTQPATR